MKQITAFNDFMADTVNLNDTRIDLLDNSFEAIKKVIRASDYAPKILCFFKHGSWAHKTIIRPVEGNPFDADVIVFVEPVEGWEASQYVNELARVFRDNTLYKDKLRVYSHCVTIEYAGERKMDIAPCVCGRVQEDDREVCNRSTNTFQRTEPEKYTEWLNGRNLAAGGNHVRKVTRLLKYLRDIKTNFTCPSFLLTTLLGKQINDGDKDSGNFPDLPTALRTIVGRLDDWLQARPLVPIVNNPVLSSENQASSWTPTSYANFRNKINLYRSWIDQAYAETDAVESLKKWRKVFGDEFGTTPVKKATAALESNLISLDASARDEVDIVRVKGLLGLALEILRPKWRRAPTWIPDLVAAKVTVSARLVNEQGRSIAVKSGMSLEPHQWIYFSSKLGGLTPSNAYQTHWRVTNTGTVAALKGALRGEFNNSDSPHARKEWLEFRGVHMVEAFVVRLADSRLVGTSEPFYVVIE